MDAFNAVKRGKKLMDVFAAGLDNLPWREVGVASSRIVFQGIDERSTPNQKIPYAVKEAALKIDGCRLRVYQLSDGSRVFNIDDVAEFFK